MGHDWVSDRLQWEFNSLSGRFARVGDPRYCSATLGGIVSELRVRRHSGDYLGLMEHYVRKEPIPYWAVAAPARPRRWFQRIALRGLLRDRKASTYSSLVPRHPDGSRTAIIPFNSSGGGNGGGAA